jgi:carbon monoxide dehydrogenase subunit G
MELEIERHERVNAPLALVWEEIDSLDRILAKTPQINDYEIVPGGRTARGRAKLAWGPVKWAVDLEVTVTGIVPLREVSFTIDAPSLEIRATMDLAVGSMGEMETRLDYRGFIEVHHRMASRMRGLFNEVLEDQAHSLLHRAKVKAEQRRLAQERLLK